jgi:hypothetical protein
MNALSPSLQLISEGLFAAIFVAAISRAQLPNSNFVERFVYYLWRYTLPACIFSSVIYWFVWGHLP